MKTCSNCGEKKSISEFNKMKARKDGLQNWCRKCANAAKMEYHGLNRSKLLKKCKTYGNTPIGKLACRVHGVRNRCTNPNVRSYKNYGARGIKICFTTRELFDWCIEHGIDPNGKEIHRIDNDGNYTLDNIEFLTTIEHIEAHREPIPF